MEGDSIFVTLIALGGFGTLVGSMLAARCISQVIWRSKREAQPTPKGEILWRLPLVFAPVTKVQYALIVAVVISSRHTAVPAWLPWAVGGAFAVVAIVQGAVGAALGNPDRSGRLAHFADSLGSRMQGEGFAFVRAPFVGRKAVPFKVPGFLIAIAILGVIETLAIMVLVATIVMLAHCN